MKRYKLSKRDEEEFLKIPHAMAFELAQVALAQAKRTLKLDLDVILITNEKYWEAQFPEISDRMWTSYARVEQNEAYVYLNFDNIRTLKKLIQSIFHECVHLKWPKWPEGKVKRKVLEYLK